MCTQTRIIIIFLLNQELRLGGNLITMRWTKCEEVREKQRAKRSIKKWFSQYNRGTTDVEWKYVDDDILVATYWMCGKGKNRDKRKGNRWLTSEVKRSYQPEE